MASSVRRTAGSLRRLRSQRYSARGHPATCGHLQRSSSGTTTTIPGATPTLPHTAGYRLRAHLQDADLALLRRAFRTRGVIRRGNDQPHRHCQCGSPRKLSIRHVQQRSRCRRWARVVPSRHPRLRRASCSTFLRSSKTLKKLSSSRRRSARQGRVSAGTRDRDEIPVQRGRGRPGLMSRRPARSRPARKFGQPIGRPAAPNRARNSYFSTLPAGLRGRAGTISSRLGSL